MLDIDFFEDAINYIDGKAGSTNGPAPEPQKAPITLKGTYQEPRPKVQEAPKQKTEPQPYSLDLQQDTITIKGQTYDIPFCFNRDMLRQGDIKTTDMVLIYLGYGDLVKPEPKQKRYKSLLA